MLKKMMWFFSLIGVLSFTSCGSGSEKKSTGDSTPTESTTQGSTPTPTPIEGTTESTIQDSTPTPINPAVQKSSKVKKTGQTTEYEAFDDGYYQKGVTPSYSRINDMVTDNITGLIWQDNEEVKTVKKNWEDAKTYCARLILGGRTDWRLPTIVELQSIVLDGKDDPAIDTMVFLNYFPNYSTYYNDDYWSSTMVIYESGVTSDAWSVAVHDGDTGSLDKTTNTCYVRCVRVKQ